MIDLHTHILPGLDDGANSLDVAVEMAKIAAEDGITVMVATPHLFRNNFVYDDLSIIKKQTKKLGGLLKENGIALEILSGAEVHISHNLIDEIRKHRKNLVLNGSAYMFVEFPSDHVFSGVKKLFFELMSEGIVPVIAHPERNTVFVRHPELLYEMIQMGSLAQANRGSFSGLYGRTVQEAVYNFLNLNFIHFIASDCHNASSSAPKLSEAVRIVGEMAGQEKAKALVELNPRAVLEDKELPYLPDPINPREKEKSFKIRIPNIFKRK